MWRRTLKFLLLGTLVLGVSACHGHFRHLGPGPAHPDYHDKQRGHHKERHRERGHDRRHHHRSHLSAP